MSELSTVVFADISGSAALFEALGNARATVAVMQVTHWITQSIESHGGRVVKKLGDGALGIFPNPSAATLAMADLLRQHERRLNAWPLQMRMSIRAGLATGQVVEVDGDCYGDAVNVASRLCERAGAAEIWATESAVTAAGTVQAVWYRRLGLIEVRGKAETLMLYQVEWRHHPEHESLTMQGGLNSHFSGVDTASGQMQLRWPGGAEAVQPGAGAVLLGRASDAHLCIPDPRVSRLHARIEWRNNAFVLTDTSSFGTWVQFEGSEAPVRLRRDSCILHGTGRIALSVGLADPNAPLVYFQIGPAARH